MKVLGTDLVRTAILALSPTSILACTCVQAVQINDWVPWRSIVVEDCPGDAHAGQAVALSSDWLAIGVPGDIEVVDARSTRNPAPC